MRPACCCLACSCFALCNCAADFCVINRIDRQRRYKVVAFNRAAAAVLIYSVRLIIAVAFPRRGVYAVQNGNCICVACLVSNNGTHAGRATAVCHKLPAVHAQQGIACRCEAIAFARAVCNACAAICESTRAGNLARIVASNPKAAIICIDRAADCAKSDNDCACSFFVHVHVRADNVRVNAGEKPVPGIQETWKSIRFVLSAIAST